METLSLTTTACIADITEDKPLKPEQLKTALDQAFLVKEKRELEWDVLKLLVKLDTIDSKKKVLLPHSRATIRLRQDAAFFKRQLKHKKALLAKLNAKVYKAQPTTTDKRFIDLVD